MNEGRILQLVTFKLENEEFGVDILKVQEINKMIDITRIPNAPSFVEGVINLRGKIIPIVDLRKRLGFEGRAYDKSTRIIVVELDGMVLGFIVDSVSEVLQDLREHRGAAPAYGGRHRVGLHRRAWASWITGSLYSWN